MPWPRLPRPPLPGSGQSLCGTAPPTRPAPPPTAQVRTWTPFSPPLPVRGPALCDTDPPTALPVQGVAPSHEPHRKGSVAGKWLPVGPVGWLLGLWRPTRVSFTPDPGAAVLTWLPEVGLGGGEDLAPGRHVVAGEGGRPGSGSGCDRFNWGRGVSPSPRSCCVRVSAHCLSWRKGKLGGQKCRGPGQESLEGSVRSGGRVDRGPRRRRAGEAVGHQRAWSPAWLQEALGV